MNIEVTVISIHLCCIFNSPSLSSCSVTKPGIVKAFSMFAELSENITEYDDFISHTFDIDIFYSLDFSILFIVQFTD